MAKQETVTITSAIRKEKTSTRTGKPFTSLGIKTVEYGDKWLSGFGNANNAHWKEGSKVEIIVEEKGEYLNFSTPETTTGDKFSTSNAEVKNLITLKVLPKLDRIEALLSKAVTGTTFPDTDEEPSDDSLDDASKQ
jgi:hypothetical protein